MRSGLSVHQQAAVDLDRLAGDETDPAAEIDGPHEFPPAWLPRAMFPRARRRGKAWRP
jgi:hypothetical protein